MAHHWPRQAIQLNHFHPDEFDRPEIMDPNLLYHIDELRKRCGFPLIVTSDGRKLDDLIRIYGNPDDWPSWLKEKGSPHQQREDSWAHAVDLTPKMGSLSRQEVRIRMADMFMHARQMHKEGLWPRQGIEFATEHLHFDNDTQLKRPWYWTGQSK